MAKNPTKKSLPTNDLFCEHWLWEGQHKSEDEPEQPAQSTPKVPRSGLRTLRSAIKTPKATPKVPEPTGASPYKRDQLEVTQHSKYPTPKALDFNHMVRYCFCFVLCLFDATSSLLNVFICREILPLRDQIS